MEVEHEVLKIRKEKKHVLDFGNVWMTVKVKDIQYMGKKISNFDTNVAPWDR